MMKMKRDVGPLPSEHLQSFSLLASSGNVIGFGDSLRLTFRKNSWCHFFTGIILVTREPVENTKKKVNYFSPIIQILFSFMGFVSESSNFTSWSLAHSEICSEI